MQHIRFDSGALQDLQPILKWAGGKRWLVRLLDGISLPGFRTYIEPFVGSGAIFFSVNPRKAILSDTNAWLIETYEAISADWERVWEILTVLDRKHSPSFYYQVRSQRPTCQFRRAAQFIYLNRTCWNGLYRVNRSGHFNVPIGTKAQAVMDTDDFEEIAARLQCAELYVADFERTIDSAKPKDLIFFDPPYTVKHKYNGFIKYNEDLFHFDDQIRLRDCLKRASSRGVYIFGTNADHESIRALYRDDFALSEVTRFSSIAAEGVRRGKYSELLITNFEQETR